MEKKEFRKIQKSLGLNATELGLILDTDTRTIRRWRSDADPRTVNPVAAKVMRWMAAPGRPKEWPAVS